MSTPEEWTLVQEAVTASYSTDPAAWVAFARCRAVALHTAGAGPSAPGGPAGWGMVLCGYLDSREGARRPAPRARLELVGLLPPGPADPAPDQTRAAAVGVLAALAVLEHLGRLAWKGAQATIWAAGPDPAFGTPDAR